jgi:hypothetical protein
MEDWCPGPPNVICLKCWGVIERRCPCPIGRSCACDDPKPWDETAELEKLRATKKDTTHKLGTASPSRTDA